MDEKEQKAILARLNQNHRDVITGFPAYARNKILTKIEKGYFVTSCTHSKIEIRQGHSSYRINRAGTTTPI